VYLKFLFIEHEYQYLNIMKNSLTPATRISAFIAAVLLLVSLWVPIWRIELMAPQYPGGLVLQIGAKGLSGDVDVVNGLNHYIGMRTLHTEDFFEFTILPYLIGTIALFGFLSVVINRKWFFFTWSIILGLFCVAALVDFYIWEYNYGHNLDPTAPIRVEGMSYQPPLIGYKKLLNFGAYSVPDIGGWLFIGAALLVAFGVFYEIRKIVLLKRKLPTPSIATVIISMLLITSCSSGPQPIKYGVDNCSHCKMKIVDQTSGAEVITSKGKVYKFDDLVCLQSYLKDESAVAIQVEEIYLTDFMGAHQLVKAENCILYKSDKLRTPMNGNIVALSKSDSLNHLLQEWGGVQIKWSDFNPLSK
jgi:copper chaperone NosL